VHVQYETKTFEKSLGNVQQEKHIFHEINNCFFKQSLVNEFTGQQKIFFTEYIVHSLTMHG